MICGLGTGRCGTKSLAVLLAAQGIDARHERSPHLKWHGESDPGRHFRDAPDNFADIGFYYLPHVPRLLDEFPDLRFICLKRNKEDTVKSYTLNRPRGTHWLVEGGIPHPLDDSYPTYDLPPDEAWGAYWDDYYAAAERLECPRFRIFDVETLNSTEGVYWILDFAGVAARQPIPCINLHT